MIRLFYGCADGAANGLDISCYFNIGLISFKQNKCEHSQWSTLHTSVCARIQSQAMPIFNHRVAKAISKHTAVKRKLSRV